jgi:DNA-binding transcriptional MocR family regulator
VRQKKEAHKPDRHVRLYHWLMRSPAWRALPATSRALYAELAKHYHGTNNGKIGYSARQAAKDLNISAKTASRHFRILLDRGFIEPMKKGAFSLKERHATEWRMTEFTCDVSGKPPTKDFMRWQPDKNLEHGSSNDTVGGPSDTSTVVPITPRAKKHAPTMSSRPQELKIQGQ